MNHRKLIIVGSGPGGLTAAVYTARADLQPLIISGLQPGGLLTSTTMVENYPGFPDGIMGPELMVNFQKQAERFGAEFLMMQEAEEFDLENRPFSVKTTDETYTCDALIISTGASPRKLGLPAEEKLAGRGVSTCATCDGAFFRGKEIVVVGGGDSACEDALFLTKFATKVSIIHRRDQLRASKAMQHKVLNHDSITMCWNSVAVDILGVDAGSVTGVTLENTKTGDQTELPCDGVFVAIGHIPNTQRLPDMLETHKGGYIVTREGTKTNIEGVFACGDVIDHVYRQAITAAGSGCQAALDAEHFLESGA